MTRPNLTDALIREALTPEPGLAAPAGLLASISLEVARTPQQHPLLRWPGTASSPASRRPASRRMAWIAIAAAAMLALVAGLLLGGGSPPPLRSDELPASPLPAELAVDQMDHEVVYHLLGVSADEAWATFSYDSGSPDSGERSGLWHRTADGWSRSMGTEGTGIVRGLSRMGDGRILVAADNGLWAGNDGGWTRISREQTWNAVVDGTGTIWATGWWADARGAGMLRSLREVDGTWRQDWVGCGAGGTSLAVAADGSVWVGGFGYADVPGIARQHDGTCTELFPQGDAVSHSVTALTADGSGNVAAIVQDSTTADGYGQIVAWDGTDWTELRIGAENFAGGWSEGLSYGPDGTLWAKISGELWRYAGGAWSQEGGDGLMGPVSVAPDGTVWFVGRDRIDHLHPAAAVGQAPAPTGSPAPPLAQLAVEQPGVHILAVSADEAWVARQSADGTAPSLWHRTAAGWRPAHGLAALDIRDLASMPDGRIVVATDRGVLAGNDDGWERITSTAAYGVSVDRTGTIWTVAPGETTGSALRSYREESGTWLEARSVCPAGGTRVETTLDGSVWTADAGYSPLGIARLRTGVCSEVFPLGDKVTRPVAAITILGVDQVAATVLDGPMGSVLPGSQIMTWDGTEWTLIRRMEPRGTLAAGTLDGIAYAPDGTLWAVVGGGLWRYAGGSWSQERSVQEGSPVAVAPDGTVWFIGDEAGPWGGQLIDHLHPDGA